jgi:DNA-binding PucR family transcriptional regulator
MVLSGAGREEAAARLPPDIPVDPIGDEMAALVPDPERPGRRAELERAASTGEALAALGPTVAWPDAPLSFSRARAALALARAGSFADSPLVVAAEHGAALLLSSDPRLVADLVRDRLAPLEALAPNSRLRLTETLEAWLAVQGRLQAAADRLQVHPQTVRYRLRRLREILGGALDDPNQRFELDLALRTRAYLGGS